MTCAPVTREMIDEYVCVGACAACMGEGLNCATCDGTGQHTPAQPGAYWPDGFRERAQAAADKVAAERARLLPTGEPEPLGVSDRQRAQAQVLATMAVMTAAITPEAPAQESP